MEPYAEIPFEGIHFLFHIQNSVRARLMKIVARKLCVLFLVNINADILWNSFTKEKRDFIIIILTMKCCSVMD